MQTQGSGKMVGAGRGVRWVALVLALSVACTVGVGPGRASSAAHPRLSKFRPTVVTKVMYAVQAPTADPARQQRLITMSDGVDLFVDVWLPAAKGGHVPPALVPTIVTFSPYVRMGQLDGDNIAVLEELVPRGYAYAQVHVRGTGASKGCFNFFGEREQRDIGEALAWLADGEKATWSDGRLGLFGISYRGTTALEAVTLAPKELTAAVKAAVIGAPTTSLYDVYGGVDGVPLFLPSAYDTLTAPLVISGPGYREDTDADDAACAAQWDSATYVTEHDGDYFDAADERELRRGASTIAVPVLMSHGHDDDGAVNPARGQAGLFDRIPAGVPKAGVFGHFKHEWPDGDGWAELNDGKTSEEQLVGTVGEWTREDWRDMVVAWFDHFVKGLPSGVERWPAAQVQNNEGSWRSEPDWPSTGGPPGRLALGAGGGLGVAQPTGSTSYVGSAYRNQNLDDLDPSTNGYPPGTSARFEFTTTDRLELNGSVELDLWIHLDDPVRDAHVTAMLHTFDAAGAPIPFGSAVGARSVRHLDPITDYFQQRDGQEPPPGTINVRIRLTPSALVVPPGGKLRLTVAGSAPGGPGLGVGDGLEHPTQLSGSGAPVTIVHDCAHPSQLRFAMPRPDAEWLDVRTVDPDVRVDRRDLPSAFDGGAASSPVCGGTSGPTSGVPIPLTSGM